LNYWHYYKTKKLLFRLVFIAEIWSFAFSITGISDLSNQQQNQLDLEHQDAFSHGRASFVAPSG
jgi:hypothetical protein